MKIKYNNVLPNYLTGENIRRHAEIINEIDITLNNIIAVVESWNILKRPILIEKDTTGNTILTKFHFYTNDLIKKIIITGDVPHTREYTIDDNKKEVTIEISTGAQGYANPEFSAVMETHSDKTFIKQYPENDTAQGTPADHDEVLTSIGNLFNIPRRTYTNYNINEGANAKPPYIMKEIKDNNIIIAGTEDDFYYMQRIKKFITEYNGRNLPELLAKIIYDIDLTKTNIDNLLCHMDIDYQNERYMASYNVNSMYNPLIYYFTGKLETAPNIEGVSVENLTNFLQQFVPLTKKVLFEELQILTPLISMPHTRAGAGGDALPVLVTLQNQHGDKIAYADCKVIIINQEDEETEYNITTDRNGTATLTEYTFTPGTYEIHAWGENNRQYEGLYNYISVEISEKYDTQISLELTGAVLRTNDTIKAVVNKIEDGSITGRVNAGRVILTDSTGETEYARGNVNTDGEVLLNVELTKTSVLEDITFKATYTSEYDYKTSTTQRTYTLHGKETEIINWSINGNYLDIYEINFKVVDKLTGYRVGGTVTINGVGTVTLNEHGEGTLIGLGALGAGVRTIEATYNGTAIYDTCSHAETKHLQDATFLLADVADTTILNATLYAGLIQAHGRGQLANKSITFTYYPSNDPTDTHTLYAVTDANGVATARINSGLIAGINYTVEAAFNGTADGGTYHSSNDTTTTQFTNATATLEIIINNTVEGTASAVAKVKNSNNQYITGATVDLIVSKNNNVVLELSSTTAGMMNGAAFFDLSTLTNDSTPYNCLFTLNTYGYATTTATETVTITPAATIIIDDFSTTTNWTNPGTIGTYRDKQAMSITKQQYGTSMQKCNIPLPLTKRWKFEIDVYREGAFDIWWASAEMRNSFPKYAIQLRNNLGYARIYNNGTETQINTNQIPISQWVTVKAEYNGQGTVVVTYDNTTINFDITIFNTLSEFYFYARKDANVEFYISNLKYTEYP